MNALMFAAKTGIPTDGATLYCTHIPCHNCLKHIIQSGIKRVVYKNDHPKVIYGEQTLKLISITGIKIIKLI